MSSSRVTEKQKISHIQNKNSENIHISGDKQQKTKRHQQRVSSNDQKRNSRTTVKPRNDQHPSSSRGNDPNQGVSPEIDVVQTDYESTKEPQLEENAPQKNTLLKYFKKREEHHNIPTKQKASSNTTIDFQNKLNMKFKKANRQDIKLETEIQYRQNYNNSSIKNVFILDNYYFIENVDAKNFDNIDVSLTKPFDIHPDVQYGLDSEQQYEELNAQVKEDQQEKEEQQEEEQESEFANFLVGDLELEQEDSGSGQKLDCGFTLKLNRWVYSYKRSSLNLDKQYGVLIVSNLNKKKEEKQKEKVVRKSEINAQKNKQSE